MLLLRPLLFLALATNIQLRCLNNLLQLLHVSLSKRHLGVCSDSVAIATSYCRILVFLGAGAELALFDWLLAMASCLALFVCVAAMVEQLAFELADLILQVFDMLNQPALVLAVGPRELLRNSEFLLVGKSCEDSGTEHGGRALVDGLEDGHHDIEVKIACHDLHLTQAGASPIDALSCLLKELVLAPLQCLDGLNELFVLIWHACCFALFLHLLRFLHCLQSFVF